jgi:hypothetical protein
MSDYAIAVIHEPLVRLIEAEAPGVRLTIGNLGPESRTSDRILVENDALIAPLGWGFPGASRALWTDRMVLIADRDNPRLVDGRLTLEDLAQLPRALGHFGPGTPTPEDRVFGQLGLERRIAMQVYGFLPLPFVIEGTDMFAVVPEILARSFERAPESRLVVVEPPFSEIVLAEGYYFSEHRLGDPAYRWLFARLDAVAAELAR